MNIFWFFLAAYFLAWYLYKNKRHHHRRHRAVKLAILINGVRGGDMDTIKNDLPATLTAEPIDRSGRPSGQVDGGITFSLSDSSFGELFPSEDGKSATFVSNGTTGTFSITATAQVNGADLSGSKEVTVEAGTPVSLKITISQ